jgi:hypothetical protein
MEYLDLVLKLVAGLAGFPALLAALINVAKYFGWLADGQAGKVNEIAHLVVYVGVGALVLLGKVDLLAGIDVQLGAVAQLLLAVLAFLSSIGIAGKVHENLAGLPVIGYSHSLVAFTAEFGED